MKYLSAKEVAIIWNISGARVRELAKKGRIPGAQVVGNSWMIPEDAIKPTDARTKNFESNEYAYRFPLTIFGNYSDQEILQFSEEEKILHQAQVFYCSCDMNNAKFLLEKLVKTTENLYVRIGALYFLCFTYMHTREFFKLEDSLHSIKCLFEKNFDKKDELYCILDDLLSVFDSSRLDLTATRTDNKYKCSKNAVVFKIVTETCRELTMSLYNQTHVKPDSFELTCQYLEAEGYAIPAMYLHHYIGTMFETKNEKQEALYHYKKAVELSLENKCYAPLLGLTFSNFSLYEIVLKDFSIEDREIFESRHVAFYEDYAKYLEETSRLSFMKKISNTDYKYINYVMIGTPNKKIAQMEGISESTVNKKLLLIYEKLGVKGKKELYKMTISSILDKKKKIIQ